MGPNNEIVTDKEKLDQNNNEYFLAYSQTSSDSEQHSYALLLHNKFIVHPAKAGLNPLVDAAACLFSMVGKLKQLQFYHNLSGLQKELIAEINRFQSTIKAREYSSEYILVSRYLLCATLDDVIGNTSWGGQGKWDSYNMLSLFNPDTTPNERFFMILERIVKNPSLYIEIMELLYICLSLGFKGNYRATEFGNHQLEQITHALYQRIRAYHGDVNKSLSPFSIKTTVPRAPAQSKFSVMWVILTTAIIIMLVFIGLGYLLDTISNETYEELMRIGKSLL